MPGTKIYTKFCAENGLSEADGGTVYRVINKDPNAFAEIAAKEWPGAFVARQGGETQVKGKSA